MENIRSQIKKAYENSLLEERGIRRKTLDTVSSLSKEIPEIGNGVVDNEGHKKEANAQQSSAIGFVSGILIYITMFIFGAMVMRGVMEEKMNRIAEVVISSVKPFQLMMGKIIGIAAVGLTQFLMWIVLIFILINLLPLFMPGDTIHQIQNM